MPVQMLLSRIIISEISDQQVIYLKEMDGDRQFPIVIGIFEATSIDRRVKERPSPRPLTHDLLVNLVQELGAELDSVVISDLREHTYFAKLRIRQEGQLIEVDARPSDAIAVAMTCTPPKRRITGFNDPSWICRLAFSSNRMKDWRGWHTWLR